jgi:glutamyl-tRNA synthetase
VSDIPSARPVRVRFAPSPTGDLHIGGVRTALFNWLFAHRHGGKFILRIEDTDQSRLKDESLDGIMAGLRWAGLQWDEGPDLGGDYGPYVQSQRLQLYQKWANWLLENGKAYKAYETPDELEVLRRARQQAGQGDIGYDRRGRYYEPEDIARFEAEGRKPVIRFKVPLGEEVTVVDMVRGPITVKTDSLQDQVLLKADGFPTYHLAVIVDDHFMEISHILRAEEWIPSAPLHKLLFDAFGWEMPQLAHVPVILHPSGGKISKRKHPEASISYFMKGGYLPEAVTNFLCNVGWNYGVKDEKGEEVQIFSKEDAAKIFDVTRVSQTGTKFDVVKLQWLNGEYIRLMDIQTLARLLRPILENAGYEVNVDMLLKVVPLIRERLKVLNDVTDAAGFFFTDEIEYDYGELIPKKLTREDTLNALERANDVISAVSEFNHAGLEPVLRSLAEQLGMKAGDLFSALRTAVTGQKVSPPLFETMEALGRDTVLSRIGAAMNLLREARPL